MKQKTQSTVAPLEFDTRMVEWNLKHNVITKDQLDKYLKTLDDDAESSESLQIDDGSNSQLS